MQSSNTLKYNIRVNPSIYAALSVFALYCSIIILLLLIFNISTLTSPLFVFLLAVAIYGAGKAYRQRYHLKLSDSGRVVVLSPADVELISGLVTTSSFSNGVFLSLHIEKNADDFVNVSHNKKLAVVIYRDAVAESEYRLLARLIHCGRD